MGPYSLFGPACLLHAERHRGQGSGPDPNPPSCAIISSHEVTQTSDFSVPGLSFLIHWLGRHSDFSSREHLL